MDIFGGYKVRFNPIVPPHTFVNYKFDRVVVFHDRAALMTYLFWAAIMPRLDRIAREASMTWARIRDGTGGKFFDPLIS